MRHSATERGEQRRGHESDRHDSIRAEDDPWNRDPIEEGDLPYWRDGGDDGHDSLDLADSDHEPITIGRRSNGGF